MSTKFGANQLSSFRIIQVETEPRVSPPSASAMLFVFNRWLDDADEIKRSWFIQAMWRADSQAGFPQTSGWRRDFTVSLWSRLLLYTVQYVHTFSMFAVFLHPPGLNSSHQLFGFILGVIWPTRSNLITYWWYRGLHDVLYIQSQGQRGFWEIVTRVLFVVFDHLDNLSTACEAFILKITQNRPNPNRQKPPEHELSVLCF